MEASLKLTAETYQATDSVQHFFCYFPAILLCHHQHYNNKNFFSFFLVQKVEPRPSPKLGAHVTELYFRIFAKVSYCLPHFISVTSWFSLLAFPGYFSHLDTQGCPR
jgi:hypothetical protein